MSKTQTISPEVLNEFQKLKQEVSNISQDIQSTNAKIWYHQKEMKKNQLVLSEVKQLPAGVPTYRAVGRMFISSPLDEVKDVLDKNIKENEKEATSLEGKKAYLEKQRLDKEKSFREIVAMLKK